MGQLCFSGGNGQDVEKVAEVTPIPASAKIEDEKAFEEPPAPKVEEPPAPKVEEPPAPKAAEEAPPAETGCVMTFEEDGKPTDIRFTKAPLGMTYKSSTYPVVITQIKDSNSHAKAVGVKVGMILTKVNGEDLLDFAQADKLIREAGKKLAA